MNFPETGFAQTPAPVSQIESVQDLVSRLIPEQKQQFDEATNAFNAQRWAGALAIFKQLLQQLPRDSVISKFAGETALNTGDTSFALSTLKPLAASAPDDWQAAALLTRACAESGDATCRDAGMARMLDLHQRGITPPGMRQYALERVKVGENILLIRASLEPWGPYKVYDLGQVLNPEGKIFLRITLESNLRGFSLDGYRETGLNSNGQRTQTHYTYKFFVGEPPYETVREEFVKIANGKGKPVTSSTKLVVP